MHTTTPILALALALALPFTLTTTLAAQTLQISGETRTTVGVHAQLPGTAPVTKSVPANQAFNSILRVHASAGSTSSEAVAAINGETATFRVSSLAASSNQYYARAGVHTDPNTLKGAPKVRFVLRSAKPVSGRVVAVMRAFQSGYVWGAISASEATVKVGQHAPGTADSRFDTVVTKEFAATIDSTGTPVDISIANEGTARSPMTFGMVVEIRFVPGHGVTAFGSTCADLHTDFPDKTTVDFHVNAVLPGASTLLLFGFRKLDVPLPGTGCKLLVDPVALVAGPKTDLDGDARIRLGLPNENFRILAQAVVLHKMLNMLQSTNGLDMEIVKR